jgi:hypothetical protein
MKKLISVLAITAFVFGFAQETPKKSCCSGKEAKECKTDDKKSAKECGNKEEKSCCKAAAVETKTKKEDEKKAS